MAELHTPHDALFRAAFDAPDLAAAFLRDHLPNEIAALLDVRRPEKLDATFIDAALAGSQSDALFRVTTRSGTPALCYLLVEHKSTPDIALPLQLASYMIRIWRRHVSEHGPDALRKLPPIVPMVLYHGERRWNVPDGLGDMITGDPALAFLPGVSYILRNIGEMPIEALSRNAALRAVLITLRRAAMEHLAEVMKSLPEGSTLRQQVTEYLSRVYDVDIREIMAELRRVGAYDMEAYMGTVVETAHSEGKAAGLAEGLAAGEARGLAEGKAVTLLRQLQRRFGPVPDAIGDRVGAADIAQLDAWLDAVLDAPSLSAVFDPTAPQ